MSDLVIGEGSPRGAEVTEGDSPEAGMWCLDLVNTVDWRTGEHPEELLPDYAALVRWAEQRGIVDREGAVVLWQAAEQDPPGARRALELTWALREALYRLFVAAMERSTLAPGDVDLVNVAMARALPHRQLSAASAGRFTWRWAGTPGDLERILWPVLLSAAGLLTSDRLERVGQCAGPGCGWLFLDTSRNHTRRWCDMRDCGNRAKARRHYHRTRDAQSGQTEDLEVRGRS